MQVPRPLEEVLASWPRIMRMASLGVREGLQHQRSMSVACIGHVINRRQLTRGRHKPSCQYVIAMFSMAAVPGRDRDTK